MGNKVTNAASRWLGPKKTHDKKTHEHPGQMSIFDLMDDGATPVSFYPNTKLFTTCCQKVSCVDAFKLLPRLGF